jgi:hypothetical protein
VGCFQVILVVAGFLLLLITFIRWFEQTAEAVDNGWWNKLLLLIVCPFVVWFYPSRVGTGRSTPVPHHEPVRGFGSVPKSKPVEAEKAPAEAGRPPAVSQDQPPPGTPKEFLEIPKVPPPKPKAKSSIDPEKIAKLKEKMRQQGMLPPDDG